MPSQKSKAAVTVPANLNSDCKRFHALTADRGLPHLLEEVQQADDRGRGVRGGRRAVHDAACRGSR